MYQSTGSGNDPLYDYPAMSTAAGALQAAGASLDGSGSGAPVPGDLGEAGSLVAAILGAYADTGARVSAEAVTIGGVIEACSAGMQLTDAQQAVAMLRNGTG